MPQREYQTGESGFSTGGTGEVLPDELSDRYFQNLDAALARVEGRQMERTLGDLGDRGFLRSGDTFSQVSEQVLGPSVERRNQILLPELRRSAEQGREERLGEQNFGRQKELAKIGHEYQLEELQKQADIKRMLLELEDSLSSGMDWGAVGGAVAGGFAGSVLGPVGAGVGSRIGAGLFGDQKA